MPLEYCGWRPLKPDAQGRQLILLVELDANLLEQSGPSVPILSGRRVPGSFLGILVLLQPGGCAPVKPIDLLLGQFLCKTIAQHIGEEMVESIPVTEMV